MLSAISLVGYVSVRLDKSGLAETSVGVDFGEDQRKYSQIYLSVVDYWLHKQ